MASTPPTADSPQPPRPAVRAVASALIVFQVLAIFIGPFAMPPATSELAASVASFFKPYVEGLCLANGYRFFAPEPGPSHLVRYEITLDDGSRVDGVFPDRRHEWPRLLYHRYFMLSEFINTIFEPNAPSEQAKAFAKGYAEHLAHEHHAKSVKLFLRRHYVPRMSEVRQGMRLSDKSLYEERPLYSLTSEAPADAAR